MRKEDLFAGQQLRKYRMKRRLTQEALATELGCSFQQVQKYESGKNRLSVSRVSDICKVLGILPSAFFNINKGV